MRSACILKREGRGEEGVTEEVTPHVRVQDVELREVLEAAKRAAKFRGRAKRTKASQRAAFLGRALWGRPAPADLKMRAYGVKGAECTIAPTRL